MSQAPVKPTDSGTDAKWLNWLPAVAGVLATILIGSYIYTFQKFPTNENPSAWGTFGDYMGGLLNPVISLFTLIVAMKVWGLQKTELLETRRAVEEQGKTAEQQRREQRFFDLFNIYQRTIDSIGLSLPTSNQSTIQHQGKDALDAWFSRRLPAELENFNKHGLGAEKRMSGGTVTIDKDLLTLAWQRDSSTGSFDHYLRVIYRLLMDSESLLGEQHFRYVKILRAQLNRSELMLLGFNMWLDNEGAKMVPLAEKYGLLKHLQAGKLRSQLEKELPPGIFGRGHANSSRITEPLEHHHAA